MTALEDGPTPRERNLWRGDRVAMTTAAKMMRTFLWCSTKPYSKRGDQTPAFISEQGWLPPARKEKQRPSNCASTFFFKYGNSVWGLLEVNDMSVSKSSKRWMLVPELQDDFQASVLYSPFREKSLNPVSWNRKMKFWENLLQNTFMEERKVSFSLNTLPNMFERKGLAPKCLSTVVEQMKSSGQLRPISYYKKNDGWLSWGFNTLVKQPLFWGVTQLIGSPKKDPDVFVCPKVVEMAASEILQQSRACFGVIDTLISLSQLRESYRDLIPADQDFEVVLTHLERKNQIALQQASNGDVVVKFCKEGEAGVSVREIDLNIYSIKTAMDKLERDISILSSKVNEQLIEAKLHVKEGNKKMALLTLRRKASSVKLIERKSGSLTILQDIIHRIEEASTNEMVLKACEAGVEAMKTLNEAVTAERAEAVMDDVQEAVSVQEEVNDLLRSPTSTAEEEELEKALAELLSGDEGQEQLSDVPVLPSVPSNKRRPPDATEEPVTHDIAAALLALELDDLGLPEVPAHSPDRHKAQDKREKASTSLPDASSS
ncbi:charged multivesicular body protein 7 [Plakobranchus ocellatus]|uniref:Charged multivesicular body protein 7 n=1 Tax=Plakobranchus ocellatus TaxID=259542 RepID=A0AAV3Y827_9GAST|nr:charged multivesicular body protein 7 [Plakobranchus ocellatus]